MGALWSDDGIAAGEAPPELAERLWIHWTIFCRASAGIGAPVKAARSLLDKVAELVTD